jgi:peptidoglycan/xylan/chitin deacetylase (PgdA/CDA1 family)
MSTRLAITIGLLVTLMFVIGALILLEPEWVVAQLRKRSPEVLYSIDTQELLVALTIDDGPDPLETPKILDSLKRHGAQATFFLITSRIPGNEELVQRMVKESHELANHLGYDYPSIRLDPGEFERQLVESDEELSKFADVRWFRPGSGWYNGTMLSIIQEHGYSCALGSVYPFDPQLGSSWFITRYVLWKIQPGSVIVLHDYGSRGARTAAALDTILPELARRGYRVVTLSELVDSQDLGE